MASNPVVNSLVFSGSVAGQASIQAQGIAGGLTFLLPNLVPVQGQLLNVVSVNGNNVFLGFTAAQGADLGDVTSVFGRSGVVTAQSGDYSYAQISGTPQLPVTKAAVTSQWLNSYTSTSGVFTSSQPNFTDLTGSIATGQIPASTITVAQINSKRGNGGFVQLAASGTAGTAGNVVTFDVNGNTVDGGTLLSSLATTAQLPLTFTPVSNNFLTGYNAGTETFSAAQPAVANLSDGSHVIVDTGSYSNPTWITSLAGAKITGNITGNAASITGSITSSQVSDLAAHTVTSFNSRQGVVSPTSGDYSVGQVTGAASLLNQTGTAAIAGDQHTASGVATLTTGSSGTITLTGAAVFSAAGKYVVHISYQGAPGGTPPAVLSVTKTDGANFTINSTDATDSTSTIAWTAVGTA